MIITYHGLEYFKIQFGDLTVAINPFSKDSKRKGPRFGADIVLVSANHPDMNGIESMSFGDKQPFPITGPGEYEVKGVFIRGFPARSAYDGERISTVYVMELENMNLAFLGPLSKTNLDSDAKEALAEADMLFVPSGGDGVLSSNEAYKFAVSLEPKVIIPMHDEGSHLATFLKEGSANASVPLEKFTVKKKDILEKEGEIVVLTSSN